MAHEKLQAIVGTAIVDPSFRSSLLAKSPEALHAFELTPEEDAALRSIRARTLHGFAGELQRWISRHESATLGVAGI